MSNIFLTRISQSILHIDLSNFDLGPSFDFIKCRNFSLEKNLKGTHRKVQVNTVNIN